MISNQFELIIYIPTFNRYEKLKNSLDIISKEIIGLEDKVMVYVSNNGSTDGTGDYLKSLEYKWLHIRHNKTNLGFALNILHCFDLPIKSEFVWPIGDDDYLMPNSISGIISLIKKYPTVDYIFCNTKAFPELHSAEVMRNYFETGAVDGGTAKSRKYSGTALVDFEKLIDPDIADTLLGELMVHCFRQSSVQFDMQEVKKINLDTVNWDTIDWGNIDLETLGKLYQSHCLPFLKIFNGKTKAVYCDTPRTFNFWGSAGEWIGQYDYTFPIVILFLISQYKEQGFISEEKFMKLLDYYFTIMRGPLYRQICGQSKARPFNSEIKAKMFEFLFVYMNKHFEKVSEINQAQSRSKSITVKTRFDGPLISIVILTFNELKYTKECLESIRENTPEPHEIIFIDNASTDGTLQWLRKICRENSNYKLIENKKNLGFAKGCNQGIEASSGEYILLLNNDVVVTENWLSGMLACLNSSVDIGIVGPMTNNISGPQKVQDIDYKTIPQMIEYAKAFREKYRHRRVSFRRIVGFCMLFRKVLVDKIGLLDESFGSGNFEDDDFCIRASIEGYRNIIAGDVFIHHYGSRTFIGNKIDYGSSLTGNRKIFSEKWSRKDVAQRFGKKLLIENAITDADECYRKGGIEKATASLIEAIKIVPEDRSIYFKLAEMLVDGKRYDDALGILESLPGGDKDKRQLALLGCSEEGLGHNDKAQEYAAHALALDPSMALALNIAGVVAYKKGEKDTAEGLFKKAIDSDPGFGESYTNLGSLRWASGEHIEALNLFERGFILSPTVADVVTAYHSAVAETGSFEKAETVFRDARALHPHDKRIAFFIIAVLIQQGKHDLAMREIEHGMIQFGIGDGILNAALEIRLKTGPLEIRPSSPRRSLSICMIVKNEELNLAKCLMSVKPIADEIIVVDTGSTDRTRAIAAALGAKVFDFAWTNNFSEARNYALSKASGEWILVIDADEIISPLDHDKLKKLVKKAKKRVAYTMVTRNYTNQAGARGWTANEGRYIHEEAGRGWFPSPKVRLFVNDKRINFINPVHELVEPALEKLGIKIQTCDVPIQHYGRLNQDKLIAKGKEYYRLGIAKIEKAQGDYNALKELGIQAAEIGEYEEAVQIWQKVLDVKPQDPVAFMNIGYAHLMLEQYEKAKVFSKNALDLDPELREAALNYSASELIAGDVKMAISTLENILKKHPDYPPAFGRMAAACLVGGRKNDGVGYLDRLHAEGFNCANVLEEQARALHAQGKNEQAVILLEVALEKGMANGRIQPLLAECRQKMKYSSCVTQ